MLNLFIVWDKFDDESKDFMFIDNRFGWIVISDFLEVTWLIELVALIDFIILFHALSAIIYSLSMIKFNTSYSLALLKI